MWFCGAYVTAACGRDKDRATRVSSLTNEEPLVVVKARINIVREVVREDCGDSCGSVVGEGKTSLCCGGHGDVLERSFGAKNGDVSCGWGRSGHRGSEVFASGGGDKDVVGVNGDVFVKWGEKESVEYFLGYAGGRGGHG